MSDLTRREGRIAEADQLKAEADAYEVQQVQRKKQDAAHPINFGQLYRVWNGSFYIRDSTRGIDTFDSKKHVESKDDDLDIIGVAATGPYGRTVFGNYRNALARFGQEGEWGGADWQELVQYLPADLKIPTNLTAEEYSTGKAPDGKIWREKIFSQAGIRVLEKLVRHRRRESEKLDGEVTIPVSASNKKKIKMHRDAGHKILVETAFNTLTGEYEKAVGIVIPKGEDMLAWVVQSLNVTTLADLVGGTDNFFAKITGINEAEKAIGAYATVLSRLGNSDLQRFMGMNATDIRKEITAAAIQTVAGIGMVDFNPTSEMMVAPTQAEATDKNAIIKAIPNAITGPKLTQWGAAGESITTSEACATGPGALGITEGNYYAARDRFNQALLAYSANPMGEKIEAALFQAYWEFQMTLMLSWSVDHANGAANVQAFDALGETGAMARIAWAVKQGIDPALALASHNEERDGFIAGVMMGAVSAMPKRLKKRLGLKSVARMIRVTGSTDFQPTIAPGIDRTETAPGVEGQVQALTKLLNALVLKRNFTEAGHCLVYTLYRNNGRW
ncbi:MAG: hypothetical protein IPJ69_06350 [Deltaproteobacteria bacterium]|nr:MAG: hypothetical protein IPJ69_06350 [Deltaproteobacteria bacterium]